MSIDAPVEVAALTTEHPPVLKTQLPLLLLLSFTITVGLCLQGLFSPLQEAAKSEMGLSDRQLGLLQGVAVAVPLALLALPLGRLTDSGRRVPLLFALAAAWTAGTIGTAFAPEFWSLFAARMLAGLGLLAIPVVISIGADLSTPETRGRSMFVLGVGKTIGQAAAFALGGAVFAWALSETGVFGLTPWRAVHLVFGVASALLLIPLMTLKEPARHEVGLAGAGGGQALGPAMRAIWERRAFLVPLYLGYAAVIMADVAAAVWAAPVLQRFYGQEPAEFAGWMGAVLLGSGVLGGLLGGVLADLGHRSKMRGGLMIGAVVAAALGVPAAAFSIMPSVPLFALALGALLLAGAVMGLITATAMALVIPNEIRGVCLAFLMIIGGVVGFGIAPTLVTFGSDALGGEQHLAQALAIVGVTTSALSVIAFGLATINTPLKPARS